MKPLILTLSLLLASCGMLQKAEVLVYRDVYKATCDLPNIEYQISESDDPGFDCLGSVGGMCLHGFYDPPTKTIHFAIQPGQRLYTTAFAHELLHAAIECRTGYGDAKHLDPAWLTELPRAKEILHKNGWF